VSRLADAVGDEQGDEVKLVALLVVFYLVAFHPPP